MKKRISIIPIILLCSIKLPAQTNPVVAGTWKGTSVCQVKNSSCHDETVVYYFSKTGSSDLYRVVASKIVEGKEHEMGEMMFTYDPLKETLISEDSTRDTAWNFMIKEKKMEGTLVYKKQLYRVVNLTKE